MKWHGIGKGDGDLRPLRSHNSRDAIVFPTNIAQDAGCSISQAAVTFLGVQDTKLGDARVLHAPSTVPVGQARVPVLTVQCLESLRVVARPGFSQARTLGVKIQGKNRFLESSSNVYLART